MLGLTAALSFALNVALVDFEVAFDPGIGFLTIEPATLGFYLSLGRFWELLVGVLLATVALATLLMIWAGTTGSAPFARAMSFAPLRFLGDNSYSWYLWHWPAIVLTMLLWSHSRPALLAAGFLSLIPAVASRTFVEEPLRKNRSIVGRKAVGLAVVCIGVPLAVAAVVYVGAGQRWGLDEPEGWTDISRAREARCHVASVRDIAPWDENACLFAPDGESDGTILVLGDSHASSISTGVIEAGNDLGYDVAIWSGSGCPFISGVGPTAQLDECAAWVDDGFALVDELQPKIVVIVNRATRYTPTTTGEPEAPADRIAAIDGSEVSSTQDGLALWEAGTSATIQALEDRGVVTAIVGTVPEFWPDFNDRYSLARPDLHPQISRAEVDARQGPVDAATAAAVAGFDRAAFLDPTDAICPGDTCRPNQGDD